MRLLECSCGNPAGHSLCPSEPDKCGGCAHLCGDCYHESERFNLPKASYRKARLACEECGDEIVARTQASEDHTTHTCVVEPAGCKRCTLMSVYPGFFQ